MDDEDGNEKDNKDGERGAGVGGGRGKECPILSAHNIIFLNQSQCMTYVHILSLITFLHAANNLLWLFCQAIGIFTDC